MKKTLLFLLGALALTGCGGGGGGGSSTAPRVAYLNASPDAAGLAFSLDGAAKASGVAFGSLTSFANAGRDDYDLSLSVTGDPELLVDDAHSFNPDADNVVVALGLKTPADGELEKRLQLAYGTIDRRPLTGARAHIVVLNALVRATDQSQTSIDFRNPVDNPQTALNGIGFGSFSATDVNSGTQSFEARQSDTEGNLIASTPLTFAAGHVYLVVVQGQEGTTGATAPTFNVIDVPTRR